MKSPEKTEDSTSRSSDEVESDCCVVEFRSCVSPVVAWDPDVCPVVWKWERRPSEPSDPEYSVSWSSWDVDG